MQVARSTAYRIAHRFREAGEAGPIDRREENGERKLDEQYPQTLSEVVASSPEQHGWPRPTWTREMLVRTLPALTGVHVQVAISLETEQGRRLRLHFLPPYCPGHNRIERAWEDLHANVTRNHTCRELPPLTRRVRGYLRRRNHRRRHNTVA